jgi:hypothetical protein
VLSVRDTSIALTSPAVDVPMLLVVWLVGVSFVLVFSIVEEDVVMETELLGTFSVVVTPTSETLLSVDVLSRLLAFVKGGGKSVVVTFMLTAVVSFMLTALSVLPGERPASVVEEPSSMVPFSVTLTFTGAVTVVTDIFSSFAVVIPAFVTVNLVVSFSGMFVPVVTDSLVTSDVLVLVAEMGTSVVEEFLSFWDAVVVYVMGIDVELPRNLLSSPRFIVKFWEGLSFTSENS